MRRGLAKPDHGSTGEFIFGGWGVISEIIFTNEHAAMDRLTTARIFAQDCAISSVAPIHQVSITVVHTNRL